MAAVRESELVKISTAAFGRMVRAHAELMRVFTQRLAKRYQLITRHLSLYSSGARPRRHRAASSNLVTLALLPAGSHPPVLGPFAAKLVTVQGGGHRTASLHLAHTLPGCRTHRL